MHTNTKTRFQHNLDAIVFLFIENLEPVGRFIKGQAVRNDERRINLALLDAFEQRAEIAWHVRLPGLTVSPLFIIAPIGILSSNPP